MSKLFERQPDRAHIRNKIMGLGEQAGRKSYYPQLQARIQELEKNKAFLEAKSAAFARMLEELDRARHRAEQSERRFRDLAELLPQTVFEIDLTGRVTFANRIAFEMFGYPPEEIERGLDCFQMLTREDRERARANTEKALRGEDLGGQQYTALRMDGGTFPCLIYASAIRDDTGITGLRGIVVDISEQARLREQKDQIEAQYHQAQKMEAIGRLAGGVAHDFNNLICPILGYSEILLDSFSVDDARRQSVETIHRAGLKARDVVRQLLAFSRKQALDVKVVDLNRVISGFETLVRRMVREDIEIRLSLSSRVVSVRADVGQIEQVIMNLLVNAQDAMPQGGCIIIETGIAHLDDSCTAGHHATQPDSHAMLAVMDTGHGMDARIRDQIFDPFFTTKEKGKGTGLGLATVYGIITQHQGIIRVTSEPGEGSRFKIYLPLANEHVADWKAEVHVPMQNQGSETVLVAEDSEMVRNLTVRILKLQGYKVFSGADAEECLALLENRDDPLDLLITDVVMGDMNGKQLFRRVAQRCPGVRVLYMSGYPEDMIAHQYVLEEGVAFIQKPFTVQGLAAKVREVLQD